MAESDLLSLFEPYRRSSDAKKNSKMGWGLGLTVVKGVADAHQGSVSVTSSEEAGTTFTLSLPVSVTTESSH
ncbi:MAG: ATP-binding protein [Proteobacteria bacterium]|nr:MAG: ATP-binding protein [Pseudomonadota bacterium]